ncbi:hypothetical protein CYLTODRAFT_375145 [Cylindrobasidium torrendii FP15055 ss-10]|uniref:Uncharacterized protein n=1 Tax=Cylindrobasidium torrendii FP15055 ss-10 TaxID=1314674 RepID=A0A0D7BCN9_9AGAR|nr:hypothetical protein CYLTODRAFT_375145 [Cylindrobasidium torrendii FP15055 ss-10]
MHWLLALAINPFAVVIRPPTIWQYLVLLAAWIFTVHSLTRTVFIPWLASAISKQVRIRSASALSIRGLEVDWGNKTVQIERITYSRWKLILEGLHVEVRRATEIPTPVALHRRNSTLLDMSELQRGLWRVVGWFYGLLIPFRDFLRRTAIKFISVAINWIPRRQYTIECTNPVLAFLDVGQTVIRSERIRLTLHINITQDDSKKPQHRPHDSVTRVERPSYGVAAWGRRMRSSVNRTVASAFEHTTFDVKLSLNLANLVLAAGNDQKPIASINDSVNFNLSFRTRRSMGLETHSLKSSLALPRCVVDVTSVHALVSEFQRQQRRQPTGLSNFAFPSDPNVSPTSPTRPSGTRLTRRSHIMQSISKRASMFTRRDINPPCTKLADTRNDGLLTFLDSVDISVEEITLALRPSPTAVDNTKLSIRGVTFFAGLSTPETNGLHTRWFGKTAHKHSFDPDIYCATLSTARIHMDHYSKQPSRHLRILSMESFQCQALATQFPSPWLLTPAFVGGDPNGPLVVISVNIGALQVTEHLSHLSRILFERAPAKSSTRPRRLASFYPVPRIAVTVQCSTVSLRLLIPGPTLKTVEARSDGFALFVDSFYKSRENHTFEPDDLLDFDTFPLRMTFSTNLILSAFFVRVRSGFVPSSLVHLHSIKTTDPEFLEDPALLTLEQLTATAHGSLLSHIQDDTQNVPLVQPATIVADLSVGTDVICVEVWNRTVVEALAQISSRMPTSTTRMAPAVALNEPEVHRRALIDRLPAGVSVTVYIGRTVVYVVHPDLNPDEDMSLSRGIALRIDKTIMQFCAMRARHVSRFSGVQTRCIQRRRLGLPEEQLVSGMDDSQLSPVDATAVISVRLEDVTIRSVLATEFAADDLGLNEEDAPDLRTRNIVELGPARLDVKLKGDSQDVDKCSVEAEVVIEQARVTFSLSSAYHTLLAARCLTDLASRRPSRPPPPHGRDAPSTTSVAWKIRCHTLQIYLPLPHKRAFVRLDRIRLKGRPGHASIAKFDHGHASVFVRSSTGGGQGRWREMLSLNKWSVTLPRHRSRELGVDGHSLFIRIPHGYATFELIQDIAVSAKGVRHLAQMVRDDQYSLHPTPGAETAKHVPAMKIKVDHFAFEMEDDPFEERLAMAVRVGEDAMRYRLAREDAFEAKIAAINGGVMGGDRFTAQHTISIDEARSGLHQVHSVDYQRRYAAFFEHYAEQEAAIRAPFMAEPSERSHPANLVKIAPNSKFRPLLRVLATNLVVSITPPSFPPESLSDFLNTHGELPEETEYSLLVPIHLNVKLSSGSIKLRDYSIPLFDVPPHPDDFGAPTLEFDTDFVIAEELADERSVNWVDCTVLEAHDGVFGARSLTVTVPKTINPVKTYAAPEIHVTSPGVTSFAWAVSYGPAIQDVMRVIDSLTSTPKDPSPALGFWDKLRLVFHWSVRASFRGEVRYYMKGLRDPRVVRDHGAGFLLSWQGHTKLLANRHNGDRELVQIISDTMLIAIPQFICVDDVFQEYILDTITPFKKVCTRVSSGVRFGLGFALERSCGEECDKCSGSPYHRTCRYFDFRPHYEVRLEDKSESPRLGAANDSYAGFRSNFIHMSISLTSSVRSSKIADMSPSSIYLTRLAFKSFWRWWTLFDSTLALPVRQGSLYPRRLNTPKLGRHLATMKYRIVLKKVHIMHGYLDESRDAWVAGITPWIGVKALVDEFYADMHQRETETTVTDPDGHERILRHKPFSEAEVVFKGLDLRALVAIFDEPLKKEYPPDSSSHGGNYRKQDLPETPLSSSWYDPDDFVELDWEATDEPRQFHLLPVVACPYFMFFKKMDAHETPSQNSKFGTEDTHSCLLRTEPTADYIQAAIAVQRLEELKATIDIEKCDADSPIFKKMTVLQQHIDHLRSNRTSEHFLPQTGVSTEEWKTFDNVYHIHCPQIFLDSAIRDILLQYYYMSRNTRGIEYHLATRAVSFIKDQAKTVRSASTPTPPPLTKARPAKKGFSRRDQAERLADLAWNRPSTDGAASISSSSDSGKRDREEEQRSLRDPMYGWGDGVSPKSNHCCLLIKPQIVLHNREQPSETCIVAANRAKLTSTSIMDDLNADDPINGSVMSRILTELSSMQVFAAKATPNIQRTGHFVPLEVLVNPNESDEFDRIVAPTDTLVHFDKFNRLRLQNKATSAVVHNPDTPDITSHLEDQSDRLRVFFNSFAVGAGEENFQTISHIISKLLLFTDAAHKTRVEELQTLLFTYDFDDMASAAVIIVNMQDRVRAAVETFKLASEGMAYRSVDDEELRELMRLRAHIQAMSDQIGKVFDAIKLAQERIEDGIDNKKSALVLHVFANEVSWNMMSAENFPIAKLVVQKTEFEWTNRRDSVTNSALNIKNLQVFDGSADALWTEIVTMIHNEDAKSGLEGIHQFLVAEWSIFPPVGGIAVWEKFILKLHPFRLQLDAKVGQRIMEYLWPARRNRPAAHQGLGHLSLTPEGGSTLVPGRSSLDSSRSRISHSRQASDPDGTQLTPPKASGLRRLGTSRSFTNLRLASDMSAGMGVQQAASRSSEALPLVHVEDAAQDRRGKARRGTHRVDHLSTLGQRDDAQEMKTRTTQKSFGMVRIDSLNILLSVQKEGSFACQDAKITTKPLEYRNQTWSFEELVDQFIPADMTWKGWVKVAFQQPLIPVFPVARELLKKTKFTAASKASVSPQSSQDTIVPMRRPLHLHPTPANDPESVSNDQERPHSKGGWRRTSKRTHDVTAATILGGKVHSEPSSVEDGSSTPSLEFSSSKPKPRRTFLSFVGRRNDTSSNSDVSSTSTLASGSSMPENPTLSSPRPSTDTRTSSS